MRYMRAWYDVFDANYEVDALPALSTCAKSFEEPIEFISLLNHNFPFISIMSLSMWLPMVYIYFFIWWWLHLTYNVRSWINEAMETNSCFVTWDDETYFHLWIGHLFCFPLYMYIMCTVRLNKTVQARFMNKCWRHDFSLHLINLYGKFFFGKKNITSNHHHHDN